MYEVYESTSGRKHYLIFANNKFFKDELIREAKAYFRCAEHNLILETGWVLNDELYFEDPHKRGSKKVVVISHWRKV